MPDRGSTQRAHTRAALVAAFGAALLALGLNPARADGTTPGSDGHGWLSAWAGVGFGDTVLLGRASVDSGSAALEATGEAPLFGVGAHYRSAKLDFGVVLEGLGSGRFRDEAGHEQRLGSAFRAAASLRWRYLDGAWGALFLRLAPGLIVLGHSDALRREAARVGAAGGDGGDGVDAVDDADGVDAFSLGFSLGLDVGAVVVLTERLALVLQLDLMSNTSGLRTPGGDVGYTGVRGLFSVGFEWRM